jgi:hypothetical protein
MVEKWQESIEPYRRSTEFFFMREPIKVLQAYRKYAGKNRSAI